MAFVMRKYEEGRPVSTQWIFGGIERVTGNSLSIMVPDRSRKTLEEEIIKHIKPDSIVFSDGWKTYRMLKDLKNP